MVIVHGGFSKNLRGLYDRKTLYKKEIRVVTPPRADFMKFNADEAKRVKIQYHRI